MDGQLASRGPRRCSREINGTGPDGGRCRPTPSSRPTAPPPAAAGSTAASTPTGSTRPTRRKPGAEQDWVAPEWGWAWPANRRDPLQPGLRRPRRPAVERAQGYVWWDAEQGKWTGHDVPDFAADKRAGLPAARGRPRGRRRSAGDEPFIMQADGKAWLYAPAGLADGPLPTHYEPQESPVPQPAVRPAGQPGAASVRPAGQPLPPRTRHARRGGVPVRVHDLPAHRAPHRGRHEPAGPTWPSCSRSCSARCPRSWPPSAGWATAAGRTSSRRAPRSRPGAGDRADPRRCGYGDRVVHQIGLPYHWGPNGLSTGDAANELLVGGAGPERAHPGDQGR